MKTIQKSISIILLCMFALCIAPSTVNAQVTVGIGVRVHVVPPLLPVYEQPLCPGDGFLWVPGYWAWNGDEYYWVPGEWLEPPRYGYLWTPCYWGFNNGFYVFHRGYWGRNVGYYGGVNYGYGYFGSGFHGGRWHGNRFEYNTAVMNVNRNRVHNVYHDPGANRFRSDNRASFNGPGGVRSRPNEQERVAMRERHIQPTSIQSDHQRQFSRDRNQFSTVNKGRPATTVMNPVRGGRQQSTVQNPQSHHEAVNRNAGQGNRPTNVESNRQVNHQGQLESNGPSNQRPVRNEMNRQQPHSSNPAQEMRPNRQHEQSAPRPYQPPRQQALQQHQQREQMAPRQQAPQQHRQQFQQQQRQQQAPQQQQSRGGNENNKNHER